MKVPAGVLELAVRRTSIVTYVSVVFQKGAGEYTAAVHDSRHHLFANCRSSHYLDYVL